MRNTLTRLWKEEDGQDLTEYALLLVLVALGAITSMSSLATDLSLAFSKAGSNLTAAT
jgi:pilus assembly protein Flp/PilA